MNIYNGHIAYENEDGTCDELSVDGCSWDDIIDEIGKISGEILRVVCYNVGEEEKYE